MISQSQMTEYVAARAKNEGFSSVRSHAPVEKDCLIFTMTNGDKIAEMTVSGLELLQNDTLAQMESLLNARFEEAVHG